MEDIEDDIISATTDTHHTVTVNAKHGWRSTNIHVERGEIMDVWHKSGQWNGDGGRCPSHGPEGPSCDAYIAGPHYPLPGVVEDSLVGRIAGEVFFIGKRIRRRITKNGVLELTINDVGHHDNNGSVTMGVTIGKGTFLQDDPPDEKAS